ncbi:hypothetical protein FIBSPDRAFT_1039582 [Athelia psychrophila]|uniref:BTB domain-containing protein n=1 Tax=Athelia psychrophila TaxID=1759441 RepID=A0A166RN51_9AGAM|nr:hypothetical protein FIBSPDRAFT_1039582 [Fibularhizoctonia sp. CBS 109695]
MPPKDQENIAPTFEQLWDPSTQPETQISIWTVSDPSIAEDNLFESRECNSTEERETPPSPSSHAAVNATHPFDSNFGRAEWGSVLRTSPEWGLLKIRNTTIRALLQCNAVKQYLFNLKLPRASFDHAEPFCTMFAPPQLEAADPQPTVEGSNDQCPIKIHEIRAAYFRAFLRLLYPSIVSLYPIDGTHSQEEWRSTLEPSTMQKFLAIQVQSIRIRELFDKLDSMTKLRLARKYAMRQRLLAELQEFAHIFCVREQAILFFFQQHTTSDINKNAFNNSSFDYQKAISEELKGELDEYKA